MNHIIIAPHPDDEVLGCYSVLSLPGVHVLYISDGNLEQKHATLAAAARWKDVRWEHIGIRENTLHMHVGTMISAITDYLRDIEGPVTVYAPTEHDYHSDHRTCWEACLAVAKPWRGRVQRLMQYEVLSATRPGLFVPNAYRPIEPSYKAEAMASVYPGEMTQGRNSLDIEALARLRGRKWACRAQRRSG